MKIESGEDGWSGDLAKIVLRTHYKGGFYPSLAKIPFQALIHLKAPGDTLITSQNEINQNTQELHTSIDFLSRKVLNFRVLNFLIRIVIMRQKKTATRKTKKTASKAKSQHNMLASAAKLEKEFHTMPAKIASSYRSELMTVKQQETKLKTELKKVQANQATSQKKLSTLKSKTQTAKTKKLMAAAKKIQDRANKSAKDLATKLTQINKTLMALDGKQATFTALGKMLAQLEKQVAKKTMKATKIKSAPKKAKAKRTKARKLETAITSTSHEIPPMMSSITSSNSSSDESVEMS